LDGEIEKYAISQPLQRVERLKEGGGENGFLEELSAAVRVEARVDLSE
jgi:hypothetical protein